MDAETEYIGELKGLYASLMATQTSDLQWPPPCTHKVFNLAMIPIKEEQGGKDNKTPIKLDNIFNVPVKINDRKVVLMEGAPGCGKSTLANFISQQWGEDKLFTEFKVVVLVRLRDPIVQKAQSISDLIPSSKDITVAKKAEESMRASNFQDVLFILDGWDELPKDLQEDSIFHKLVLDGKEKKYGLHNSAVIVTSRPEASNNLHSIEPTRIEILGFTPKELNEYFQECLGDSKAVKTLQEQIEENPEIAGICCLPLNANILIHLFKHRHGSDLPTSQYGIFSLLVCTCISRHLQERSLHRNLTLETLDQLVDTEIVKEPFQFLCNLAYNGVMSDRITFSSLPDNTDTLSILHGVESFVKPTNKIKSFTHLSIQELLAAFYMVKWLPPEEQVASFNKLFNNPRARFNAVFQFYSAMTKLQTPGINDVLTRVAKQCSAPNPVDEDKLLLKAILHCLYAAQDSSRCELIIKYIQHGLNLSHKTLNPTDCLCIGYFLSCVCNFNTDTHKFKAKLFNCNIGDKGCKCLVKGLQKYPATSDNAATSLYMDLKWNNIHEEGSIELSRLLEVDCIDALNLNGNEELFDQGTFHIAEKLKINTSLAELQLYTCGLTAKGVCYIAEALTVNKTLTLLNIGGNGIYDEGIKRLAGALGDNHSLKSLDLSSCGMTDLGLKHIAGSLQLSESLKELKIHNFQNQKHLNEITINGDAIEYLIDTIGKTSTFHSLVLPMEFISSLPVIQESVNKERKLHNLPGIEKVNVHGKTIKEIKGMAREVMEVEKQPHEMNQNQASISRKSKSPDIVKENKEPRNEFILPELNSKKGYTCAAQRSSCLVYVSREFSQKISIETISELQLHPQLQANEIRLTSIIRIFPQEEVFSISKPAIVELMKILEPNPNHDLVLLYSFSNPFEWKKLASPDFKMLEDRIVFKTTHFGYFTVIARFSLPTASVTVEPKVSQPAQLMIQELPGFKMEIPPTSVHSKIEITATVHYDDLSLCGDQNNYSPASAFVMLEPHNVQFEDKIMITVPIPYYAQVKRDYPNIKLELWHIDNLKQGAPMKLKVAEESSITIDQDYDDNYLATAYVDHFSGLLYLWNAVVDYCLNFFVRNIHGRCQVFMSREAKHGSCITFEIAVLLYPFKDPYSSLPNYPYLLYDSVLPITLVAGEIKCQIEFHELLLQSYQSSQDQQCYTKNCIFPKHFNMRVEFDIQLDATTAAATELPAGKVATLVIEQAHSGESLSFILIKPSARNLDHATSSEFFLPENSATVDNEPLASTQPTEARTSISPHLVIYAENIRFSHIRLIKWNNDKGEVQRFYLMEKISHKWWDIGQLLDIPHSELESTSMKYHGDPKECCRAVLVQWLDNPPPKYPTTWQGLIDLLEDSQLGHVVSQLRNVLRKLYL